MTAVVRKTEMFLLFGTIEEKAETPLFCEITEIADEVEEKR